MENEIKNEPMNYDVIQNSFKFIKNDKEMLKKM